MILDEADLDLSNEDPKFVGNSTVLELNQTEKKRSSKVIRQYKIYSLIKRHIKTNKEGKRRSSN